MDSPLSFNIAKKWNPHTVHLLFYLERGFVISDTQFKMIKNESANLQSVIHSSETLELKNLIRFYLDCLKRIFSFANPY